MKHSDKIHAFSLVEVVLALGVASFCMLTMFALVPLGLANTKDSLQKTIDASIVTQITGDLKATPITNTSSCRFQIGLNSPGTNTLFFASDGSYSGTSPAGATYQATVVVIPPTNASLKVPTNVRIIITWPGMTGTAGTIPSTYRGYFEAVLGLDRN